jgi:hypothetical protein
MAERSASLANATFTHTLQVRHDSTGVSDTLLLYTYVNSNLNRCQPDGHAS